MLKALGLSVGLVAAAAATAAAGERIRQFHAETATPVAEIVAALEARLPDGPPVIPTREGAMLSYAGRFTPAPLKAFVEAAFPALEARVLDPGSAVTLSLVLSEVEGVTDISLMVMAAFTQPGAPMIDGARVLLDGTGPGACEGQVILSHDMTVEAATEAYLAHLESEGYRFAERDPREMSFFVGHAPDCAIALYVQRDATRTVVAIRYLEE